MLAEFQGIVFKAEKHDELPCYHLSKNKKHIGSVILDSKRFHMNLGDGEILSFNYEEKDFRVLDYDIVNVEWVKNQMEVKNINQSQLAQILNISDSQVSLILSGERKLDGSIKSSLFNFFK